MQHSNGMDHPVLATMSLMPRNLVRRCVVGLATALRGWYVTSSPATCHRFDRYQVKCFCQVVQPPGSGHQP